MRWSAKSTAAAVLFSASALADLCAQGSEEIDGNWYCQPVNAIQYSNMGVTSSYDQVTNMEGSCDFATYDYSGSIAPLDEEVSLHFRGPIQLKQVAVYTPNSASKRDSHIKHHMHDHMAKHVDHQRRAAGGYSRIGYYNSGDGTLDGLVFLANLGGDSCSGTWDTTYGNSLSYVDASGTACAPDSTVLGDVTIPSDQEVILFTDEPCGDDDCFYYRPGTVAYHGFNGADKIFMFEFSMPSDTGSTAPINVDMPAIWMLNAQIPRTVQYGSCSCWATGCGEFDIVEVLTSGSTYMKSTLHDDQSSGDSDYIVRPTDGTMKLSLAFSSAASTITIQVLDNGYDFGDSLSSSDAALLSSTNYTTPVSTFVLPDASS